MTLLSLLLSACTGSQDVRPEEVVYSEITYDTTRTDAGHAYHILVPAERSPDEKLPLVVILDAHGNGNMAVRKFQPAVQYFPCLLAGSDLIKNNFAEYETAISALLTDLRSKYPVDEQHIIVAGFSGGARMAYAYALRHPVGGVLMCGAGPGEQLPACPVYAISGMGDFNFSEQYVRPAIVLFDATGFTADYFHGIHEWPRPELLSDALLFLLRDRDELTPIRKQRSMELRQLADSLSGTGDEFMAIKALEKAAKLSADRGARKQALSRGQSLLQSASFMETIRVLEQDLDHEQRIQQAYYDRLFTEHRDWWEKQMTALNRQIEAHPQGLKADHYLRIKGYAGILFYSVINRTLQNDPGNPQLDVMLDAYAFAEPQNPDVYFFRAWDAWNKGKQEASVEALRRAMALGYSDKQTLAAVFPGSVIEKVLSPTN
jgi:pimeloyl-ACP methyl ester carboxylesterase